MGLVVPLVFVILAAFGLSLAVFYRSSGVVNFATGAIGMYAAYTYYEL